MEVGVGEARVAEAKEVAVAVARRAYRGRKSRTGVDGERQSSTRNCPQKAPCPRLSLPMAASPSATYTNNKQ